MILISEKARVLAERLHKKQLDKAGVPYIEHLRNVANHPCILTEELKSVAWLHDSVEDAHYSINDIRQEFGDVIAEAVDAITKRAGENYQSYLERVKSNSIARVVKLADLAHNLDFRRLPQITEKDIKRAEKYKSAVKFLEA